MKDFLTFISLYINSFISVSQLVILENAYFFIIVFKLHSLYSIDSLIM